jgi:hypothetical protein
MSGQLLRRGGVPPTFSSPARRTSKTQPGKRVSVVAKNLQEARDLLTEEYGTGHVVSLWNEADSNRPR